MNKTQLTLLANAKSQLTDASGFIALAREAIQVFSEMEQDREHYGEEVAELEAFRSLAAEVKYYVDKWPKYAGEHMKRLAALCPEGREWTPDLTT